MAERGLAAVQIQYRFQLLYGVHIGVLSLARTTRILFSPPSIALSAFYHSFTMSSSRGQGSSSRGRGRGRPQTYVFDGQQELSESMEKLKLSIERRREAQRANYHRKKQEKKNKAGSSKRSKKSADEHRTREHTVEDGGSILDLALSGTPGASSSGSSSTRPKK